MAQAHAGLGCRVTVVEADRIAGREDAELAGGLRAFGLRGGCFTYQPPSGVVWIKAEV